MDAPAPDALARLAGLHRDTFVIDDRERSTVDLAAHRGDSSLDDLDLGVDEQTAPTPAALLKT